MQTDKDIHYLEEQLIVFHIQEFYLELIMEQKNGIQMERSLNVLQIKFFHDLNIVVYSSLTINLGCYRYESNTLCVQYNPEQDLNSNSQIILITLNSQICKINSVCSQCKNTYYLETNTKQSIKMINNCAIMNPITRRCTSCTRIFKLQRKIYQINSKLSSLLKLLIMPNLSIKSYFNTRQNSLQSFYECVIIYMFGQNFVFSKAKPAQTQKTQNKIEISTSKSSFEKQRQTTKYNKVQEQSYSWRHSTQHKDNKEKFNNYNIQLHFQQNKKKTCIYNLFDALIEQNTILKEKNLSTNEQIELISSKYSQMLQKLEQNNQIKLYKIFFGNIMLIHRQYPLNPTNFHKYIDNHPYIYPWLKLTITKLLVHFQKIHYQTKIQ